MADLKERSFSIKVGFEIGKTASKMHDSNATVPCGDCRLLSGFLDPNMRKLQLKIVSVHVIPPQVA